MGFHFQKIREPIFLGWWETSTSWYQILQFYYYSKGQQGKGSWIKDGSDYQLQTGFCHPTCVNMSAKLVFQVKLHSTDTYDYWVLISKTLGYIKKSLPHRTGTNQSKKFPWKIKWKFDVSKLLLNYFLFSGILLY